MRRCLGPRLRVTIVDANRLGWGFGLDAIEKAIRTAFEKGNAEERSFREKVYRSAFAALDRALQAAPNMTVEMAIKRRKALQAKIAEIETEFLPAVAPKAEPAAPPAVDPVASEATAAEGEAAPAVAVPAPGEADPVLMKVDPDTKPDLGMDSVPAPDVEVRTSPAEVREARAQERVARRRPYAAIFFAVTLVAAALAGGWWAYRTGVFQSAEELDTSVPNPPPTVEDEDFVPAEQQPESEQSEAEKAEAARNWISVFSPADPSGVKPPEGATAEVSQDESGSFLRIRSGSSGEGVVFDVGQGVLEQIVGKKAVFDIVARGGEGKETQISVSCSFGELGDCGRKRYAVGFERGEYLFDVELPSQPPPAVGTIAINSDFAKEGKSVDVYEIRVSATP